MYRVRFYKRRLHFYLFKDRVLIYDCLTFSGLIRYLEEHCIDFNNVKLNCSFNDLFKHIVDYESIQRLVYYINVQEEKKRYVPYENRF